MKIMNISCSINVCDPVQLKAYIDFMHALGGQSVAVTTTEAPAAPAEKTKLSRAKAEKAEAVETQLTVEKSETVETPTAPVEKEKTAIKGLDLEHLRGRVGGFIKTRPETREAIKAALSSHGAASVSTLDPSDFESFNNFLDTF
jgi:hypothetical protein